MYGPLMDFHRAQSSRYAGGRRAWTAEEMKQIVAQFFIGRLFFFGPLLLNGVGAHYRWICIS
jgi:hypothetical protein